MEDFLRRIDSLTVADLGTQLVKELRQESHGDYVKEGYLNMKLENLEKDAKLNGTYFVPGDDLWEFKKHKINKTNREKQLEYFSKISRKRARECYQEIVADFNGLNMENLPDPSLKSVAASRSVKGRKDIFNNEWNNQKAHLIPNSPVCAAFWGHSAEGAFQPLNFDGLEENKARLLLVMGYKNARKLRSMPQNFIRFSAHRDLFDVDPSVVIIPIMPLEDVRDKWQDDMSYEALVIANDVNKPGFEEQYYACSAYIQMLGHFKYEDNSVCTKKDIDTATELIRDFLLGHAESLVAGIPMSIDSDDSINDKETVLEDLKRVKKDIARAGVSLPYVRSGKLGKVLKIRFAGTEHAPIPDPWLLAAKAAVNLSSTQGQKLLPTCNEDDDEEEDDEDAMRAMYEYQIRHRQTALPMEVNLHDIGEAQDTPPRASRSGGPVVVTPPQEVGGDDWENLGD